jgi:putative ABC transport system permease protein
VLRVTTPTAKQVPLKVVAIVKDEGLLLSSLTVSSAVLARDFGQDKDTFAIVGFDPGANVKATEAAVKQRIDADFPSVQAKTAKEFKDEQAGQVDQLLYLIYALLALAIIVSLFGIVNTLVLSITERTRELGMLRAIGTSRRQVRRMIRYEAVITALIGGVLGIVLGVVLAVLVTSPLDNFVLSLPVVSLIVVLLLAGVAGVVAAILPARRASRLDVLDALAYE